MRFELMPPAVLMTLLFAAGALAGSWEDVSAEDAWFLSMHDDVITVDVSPIYDQGHIPGSISAPLGGLEEALVEWDSGMTYLVYCHSRQASEQGAQTLLDAGFESVRRLDGDFAAWTDAGYPVEVAGEYMDVTPEQALDLTSMNNSLVVVDVSMAYQRGHLPGAINVPVSRLEEAMAGWSMDDDYLVYCHGDPPSIRGARMLAEAGFSTVYRLQGNYGAWVEAGYTTETD